MKHITRMVITSVTILNLVACDQDKKKECHWTLEPEPKLVGWTDPGYIPVCARNRENMKQDCKLQATLEYAKEVHGRKFRLADVKKEPGVPHTVTDITFCD